MYKCNTPRRFSYVVFLFLVRSFSLMSLENGDSFLDLALERVVILQHVEQLGVVDLEQHSSDLAGVKNLWGWGMVGMKYPPMPICCMPAMPCILMPAMRWMYCEAR